MKTSMLRLSFLVASLVALWVSVNNLTQVVFAQETHEVLIEPAGRIQGGPAELRTPEAMEQTERELEPIPTSQPPFIPTMDPAEYAAQKAKADQEAEDAMATGEVVIEASPRVEPQAAPTPTGINFNGINQTAATDTTLPPYSLANFPPDTHGAVGPSHYVQVVNFRVVVYDKLPPHTMRSNRTLRALFERSV